MAALQHDKEKREHQDNDLLNSYQAMATLLTPDTKNVGLNDVFSELLIAIMQNRVEDGITVSSVVPHKNPGNSGVSETARLKEQVPSTGVGSIRVNVRGSYENYDGFVRYIQALRKLPISVVYLKVEDHNFEIGLRVYGN